MPDATAMGAMLLGPMGMLIGGLTGSKKSVEMIRKLSLKVYTTSGVGGVASSFFSPASQRSSISLSVNGWSLSELGMIYPPPGFDTRGLPKAEELEALHLWDLLDDLAQFTLDFEAALDLLDVAEQMLKQSLSRNEDWGPAIHAQRWPYVPARDAAVTLYQFGWTLVSSIPDALRRCPAFMAKVDHSKLKAARRQFEDGFKSHHLLRHAVGHAAEIFQTREAIKQHAAVGMHLGGGRFYQRGNLLYRTLSYTIDGKEASVPITRDTLATLERLAVQTFEGFAPVSWSAASLPTEVFE